jgi:predicted ATPase/DNA-binding CsgD family transcriptional regulator
MTIRNETNRGEERPSRLRSGRVPAPVSSFIGRSRELAELTALLDTGRLITLTGPGGSGKTRLAIELAEAVPDSTGGPFIFVDLSPLTELTRVPRAIGTALGVREQPDEPMLETLARRIGDRPRSLILDNLEQLPGVGGIVGDLLSRCPNLRIVATSRGPLHVRGEREYPVGPLAIPSADEEGSLDRLLANPSIALFVDRARAIDPRFELTNDNAAAVAEICRRLDGLPLAIELAAARIRMFGPGALLARLGRRLALLTDGATDAPARQRTLRDTIAWSVDLLERDERDVFADVAVFVGGFSGPAAAAVVSTSGERSVPDLIGTLERLVDRNLLTVGPTEDDEPRFGMLETIREFAWDALSEARRAELRQRHLAHFVDFVEALQVESRSASQGAAIRRLLVEQANIRAALVHAREADPQALIRLVAGLQRRFWYAGDGVREGFAWFEEAHRVLQDAPPAVRIRMLLHGAWLLGDLGDSARGTALFEESLAASDAADDHVGRFEAWIGLGYIALATGDVETAQHRMETAMSLAERTGQGGSVAEALVGLGHLARMRGDVVTAGARLDEAVALARSSDDPWAAASALFHRGDLQRAVGEAVPARVTFLEAFEQARAAGDAELSAWATIGLVRTATLLGRLTEARSILLEAARSIRQLNHPLDELFILDAATEWFAAAGSSSDAVETWAEARRARSNRVWSDPPDEVRAHERFLRLARRELGPVRFQAAQVAGETRGFDEALEAMIDAVERLDAERVPTRIEPNVARQFALTPREQEIAALVAAGMSDGEIADALVISKKTVSVHVANVKGKLGARNRVEIATIAARLGLTTQDASPERSIATDEE